jgi:hypothetical protein
LQSENLQKTHQKHRTNWLYLQMNRDYDRNGGMCFMGNADGVFVSWEGSYMWGRVEGGGLYGAVLYGDPKEGRPIEGSPNKSDIQDLIRYFSK